MAQPLDSSLLILIVEDDDLQRELLRSILELESYRVTEASDGFAALEVARREKPDLIITDNFMPGLDGYALIGAIREDANLKAIPVVLLSAGDDDVRTNRTRLRAGLDCFMQKPIQADELMAVLRATLGRDSRAEHPSNE